MTTGNTTLLGLALPVDGELDGTWGDAVNNSVTSLLDSAVAGTTTLSADADVTLTSTVLAANQARQAIILWTATSAVTRNITAPAQSKPYIVINAGTNSVVLRGAGPTTGITVVSGERCLAAWNGSDFVKIATSVADGVTSVGGTGTVNGISLSGTVTSAGNLTLGGSLTGVNLATQVTGTLPVANGGTGATTLTANNVIIGNGTSAPLFVAPGTSGNVLTSNGTTWTSAAGATGNVTLDGTQTLTNKTISGADNTLTVDGTTSVGFRTVPQNSQSGAYTLVLADSGKHILHPSADTTARTFTIPANSSVAYPIGTAITFINQNGAGVVTIAITTDTMRLSPEGTTGSRTLAANGSATCIKVTSTEWLISGSGLT